MREYCKNENSKVFSALKGTCLCDCHKNPYFYYSLFFLINVLNNALSITSLPLLWDSVVRDCILRSHGEIVPSVHSCNSVRYLYY